ncbi:MAG: hypothetical protein V7K83_31955 [Nostoc sp.]
MPNSWRRSARLASLLFKRTRVARLVERKTEKRRTPTPHEY